MQRVIQTAEGRYQARHTSERDESVRVRTFDRRDQADRWLAGQDHADKLKHRAEQVLDSDSPITTRFATAELHHLIVEAIEQAVPVATITANAGMTQRQVFDVYAEAMMRRRKPADGYDLPDAADRARLVNSYLKQADKTLHRLNQQLQHAMTAEAANWMFLSEEPAEDTPPAERAEAE